MKITDLKTVKKSRVKEAINPALSFEHDDPEFAAKKRGMGYFDYSTMKREDFNDDDWYIWNPKKQQFVASYGAKSLTALDFRMRASFGGTYKMPDGNIAMRGSQAAFMPGIERRNPLDESTVEQDSKTLQMIESWGEFKETAPALKEIRHRRRRTNEGMSRRAFLGGLGSLAAGAALGHAYTKDQQQQAYKENVQQAELFTDRAEQALATGDIKSACRYFSRAADAYDNAGLEKFAEPLRRLSLDCMKKSGMSQGKGMIEGKKKRKKKSSRALSRYFFPGYGYYGGGESGEGGGEGGGESIDPRMTETRKSDFRNAAEQQAERAVERIKNSDYPDVVKQYLIAINDPSGPVFKAAYYSYSKGNEARDRIKNIVAQKYNVDPDELEKAELDYIATQLTEVDDLDENLRDWFKDKWVRFGPDGKIRGDCARGSESEGKPKCLPQAKAHALGKKGRASAAARKRREDPNANRTGAAINVATKKKTNEVQLDEKCWDTHRQVGMKKKGGRMVPNCVPKESQEQSQQCPECGGAMYPETMITEKKDACYYKVKASAKVWPSAYASGRLVQCRKRGASNYGKKSESVAEDTLDEKWSKKYKSSINCSNPKGFSQRAHCAGRKKNESVDEAANAAQQAAIAINMKKHHKKPKGVAEATGDPKFDKMIKGITGKRQVAKQQRADTKQQASDAFSGMFGGGNPADKLGIRKKGMAEGTDDLSQYSTERLQAYVKKVSGGGVPAFGSGAQLKRVQAELKRRESGVAEGRFDEPLTGWHIVYRKSGNPVHATPSFETKDQAQKYLMTKMFANHQDYKVVHTAGVGVAEGADDIAQAKERLAYLEKIFDTSYEYSDDHSVWRKHNAIRQEMDRLKKIIGQSVDEDEDNKDAAAAKKPGFIDDVKQGAEDYKDLWMMGATGRTPERWKTSAEKAAERGSAPGPQFPLKEGRMKEIAIEFQDYKHLPDMAFQSRYKISKRDWWNKYAKLVQGAGLGIGMDEARGKVKAKVVHPRPTRAEREHDRIRKERGLPNPSHYKTLGDRLAKEIAALRGDDVTEANVDADELVDVYVKGQHKGRSLRIPVAKNFPNKHIDLLTQRLKAKGINPHAIVYGPTTRKVAEDTDQ